MNDSEYSYTVTAADGETPAEAVEGLATVLRSKLIAQDNIGDAVVGTLYDAVDVGAAPVEVTYADLSGESAYTVPFGKVFFPASFAVNNPDLNVADSAALFGISGGQTFSLTTESVYDLSFGGYGLVSLSEGSLATWLTTWNTDNLDAEKAAEDLLVSTESALFAATVDGSTLKLTAPVDKGLDVAIGDAGTGVKAIVNDGLPTSYEVSFANVTWPTPTNGDNTTVFDRKLSVTIDTTPDNQTDGDVTITADVAYDTDGNVDIAGSIANLVTAINSANGVNGVITASVDAAATDTIVLTAQTPPAADSDAPTFTVDGATVDQNGAQQETKVAFSTNDADYYEGGTLSVEIAGETVTADMVAGDAAASVAALKAKIDEAAKSGLGGLEAVATVEELTTVKQTVSFVAWGGDGTTRDIDETAFLTNLETYGKFIVPLVEVNGYAIRHPSYLDDLSWTTKLETVDKAYSSMDEWIASVSSTFSEMTDRNVSVTYDPDTGQITFAGFGAGTRFSGGTFQFVESEPSLILTAATEEPDPLSVTAEQTYAGEYQQATFVLEDVAQYSAFTDGTVLDTLGRGADVYFDGGEAHLTITGAGEDGVLGTSDDTTSNISAEMVLTSSSSIITIIGVPSPTVASSIAKQMSTDLIAISIDGTTYDTLDFETYLGGLSPAKVLDTSGSMSTATFDDLVAWINTLSGVDSAVMTENVIEIQYESGVEGEITDLYINRFDPEDPNSLSGSLFASAVENETVEDGPGLTSQALVDAINDKLEGVEATETPAVIRIEGNFSADTKIADSASSDGRTELTFSWSGTADGFGVSGNLSMVGISGSSSGIYYLSNSNAGNFGSGYETAVLSDLLSYIGNLPEFESAVIDDGDIVITTAGGGTDTDVSVTLTVNTADFQSDSLTGEDFTVTGQAQGGGDAAIPADPTLSALLENAELGEDGTITLTARDAGKETFEITDVTLDYEGVKQIATISLEDAAQYTALTDGTDLGESDRGADLYFDGGRVYADIDVLDDQGGVDRTVTVSADMADPELIIYGNMNDPIVAGEALTGVGSSLSLIKADGTVISYGIANPGDDTAFDLLNWIAQNNLGNTIEGVLAWANAIPDIATAYLDDFGRMILEPVERVTLQSGGLLQFGDGGAILQGQNLDAAVETTLALADAIQAEIDGVAGKLTGVLASATVDGTDITLEAAEAGKQTFEVSDVRIDYEGVKQIAEVDFTALDDDSGTEITYFDGGKLEVTVQETLADGTLTGEAVTISAAMADGDDEGSDVDEAGSLAALVEEIEAAISPTKATVAVGTDVSRDDLVMQTNDSGNLTSGFTQFKFFYDADGDLGTQADYSSFIAKLGGANSYSVSDFVTNSSKVLGQQPSLQLTLGNFIDWLNNAEISNNPLPVSFSVEDGQLVMSAREGGDSLLGLQIAIDSLGNVGLANDGEGGYITGGLPEGLGFLGSVSEENGVITLTSADNVTQQFTVTAATASDPAKVEVTDVSFSTTDSDYFATGIDSGATTGQVSVTVKGDTFTADMVEGGALATAQALLAEMEATEGGLDSSVASVEMDLAFGDVVDSGESSELRANRSIIDSSTVEYSVDTEGFASNLETFGSFTLPVITIIDDGTFHQFKSSKPYTRIEEIEDWAAEAQAYYRENFDSTIEISYDSGTGKISIDATKDTPQISGWLTFNFDEREVTGIDFTFTGAQDGDALNISASASTDAVKQVTKIDFGSFGDDDFIGGIGRDVSVSVAGENFTIDGSTRLELLQDLEAQLEAAIIADTEGTGEGISAVLDADGISIDEGDVTTAPSMTLTARYGGDDPLNVSTLTREEFDPDGLGNVTQQLQIGFAASYLEGLVAGKTLTLELGQSSASYIVQVDDTPTTIVSGLASVLINADYVASAAVNGDNDRFIDIEADYPGPDVLGSVESGQDNTIKLLETNGQEIEVTTGFFVDQTREGVIVLGPDDEDVATTSDETEGADLIAADTDAVTTETSQAAKAQSEENVAYTNAGMDLGEGDYDSTFFGDADQSTIDGTPLPSSGDYSFAELTTAFTNLDNSDASNYGGASITNDLSTDGVITHTFDFSVFNGSSYAITDTSNAEQVMRAFERSLSLDTISDLNAITVAANGNFPSGSVSKPFLILLTDSDTGNSYLWSAATDQNGTFFGATALIVESFEGYTPTKLAGVTVEQTHINPDSGYTAIDNSPQFDGEDLGEGDGSFFGDPDQSVGEGDDGISQSFTNPDNSYSTIDDSPQFDDEGAGEGNEDLFGSDPGYYDDEGLWTSYLNGGTEADSAADDGEGNSLYDQLDGEDLDPINVGDGTGEGDGGVSGENAGTEALTGEDIAGVDGFAPFDWDESELNIISTASIGADVIDNFQVAYDAIGIEGALLASTDSTVVVAAESAIVSLTTGTNATESDFTSLATNGLSLVFDWAEDYDAGRIEVTGGQFIRVYDEVFPDGSAQARFNFGYPDTPTKLLGVSYDDLDDFVSALNGTQDQGPDALNITGSIVEGNLVLSLNEPYSTDYNDGGWRVYNQDMVLEIDALSATGLDLSLVGFGLVDAAESTLSTNQISVADEVAELLGSIFDFTSTTDNGEINTSIFAVTASDDATSTAIWAHTQSTSEDDTVEAEELNLLSTVNTTGGEFSADNFAIWDGASFQQPILQAQEIPV